LYGLTFTNPKPIRDGQSCPPNICSEISYSGGTYIYSVTGFTTYSSAETGENELLSCGVLNESKTYYLNTSITNSNNMVCMNITASNVVLDCQGYSIDGSDVNGSIGIYAKDVSNITIRNCKVSDWGGMDDYTWTSYGYGIYLENITDSLISNTNVTSCAGGWGLLLNQSNSNTLTNLYLADNYGENGENANLELLKSNYNVIDSVTSKGNGYGIALKYANYTNRWME